MLSPTEAHLRAKIGALSLHAGGGTNTGPARRAFLARFEVEVDPGGTLPLAERQSRAEYARRAYFAKLSLKSAQARRRRAERKGRGAGLRE
jgi:hypothetical protein